MQRDIADAIGIEGATLTHHLNRMEDEGYVRRERASGDRRSQLVTLTPAGEEQFAALLRESSRSTGSSAPGSANASSRPCASSSAACARTSPTTTRLTSPNDGNLFDRSA